MGKIATEKEAAAIGGLSISVDTYKLVSKTRALGLDCLVNGLYDDKQLVPVDNLIAGSSSISASLNLVGINSARTYYRVSITGGLSYVYGPTSQFWSYYSGIPNNYIKAGATLNIIADCGSDNDTPNTQAQLQIVPSIIVDNKRMLYVEKISGYEKFENSTIRLNEYMYNMGSYGGSGRSAVYKVHFDINNTTYITVNITVRPVYSTV